MERRYIATYSSMEEKKARELKEADGAKTSDIRKTGCSKRQDSMGVKHNHTHTSTPAILPRTTPFTTFSSMIAPPFIFTALLLGALTLGCEENPGSPSPEPHPIEPDSMALPYNLDQPDAVFALPAELLEISGLAALDSTHLAAVQDEAGIIYVLDRETAHITARGRVRLNGDSHATAVAGGPSGMPLVHRRP